MSFTGLAIRIAVPNPKIESLDRFLFVGPHPDDLEIGAGATAAKLAAQGKKVCFLICMDGRFGDGASNGVKGDALAALRMEEARKSAAVLGVTDVRFLNLCDGNGYDQNLYGVLPVSLEIFSRTLSLGRIRSRARKVMQII